VQQRGQATQVAWCHRAAPRRIPSRERRGWAWHGQKCGVGGQGLPPGGVQSGAPSHTARGPDDSRPARGGRASGSAAKRRSAAEHEREENQGSSTGPIRARGRHPPQPCSAAALQSRGGTRAACRRPRWALAIISPSRCATALPSPGMRRYQDKTLVLPAASPRSAVACMSARRAPRTDPGPRPHDGPATF